MSTSFSLVISQLPFCHRYDDVNLVVFQIHRFAMSTSRGRIDPGAVSGNETQFAFSDGDVHDSETDNRVARPALG